MGFVSSGRRGRWPVVGLTVVLCSCIADEPASGPGESSLDQPACEGRVACSRVVFVTSKEFTGDLGGFAGADARCKEAAAQSRFAFVRMRTYQPWLGNAETHPKDRLAAGSAPYRRTDGTVVAASFAELAEGRLQAPINHDENGDEVGGPVWTGTERGGVGVVHDCYAWARETAPDGSSASAIAGSTSKTDEGWATGTDVSCAMRARLYCFER